MPDFIITKKDFEQMAQNQSPIPDGFVLKCRSKASIFRTLNTGKDADGIMIRIIRRSDGKPDVRISKYLDNQVVKNGFVILRDVLEDKILRGSFIALYIYIYTEPAKSLIIAGGDKPCGAHGGEGGEGVKVRIPT